MKFETEPPKWIRNDPKSQDHWKDGSSYLVATVTTNRITGIQKWDIDKVRLCFDEDGISMAYVGCCEEVYDEWCPEDWNYYIELQKEESR